MSVPRIFSIELAPSVSRALKKLDPQVQKRIGKAIDALRGNPLPAGVKKLNDPVELWRIRVGDYRVIYKIEEHKLVIVVVKVAHRREVYR